MKLPHLHSSSKIISQLFVYIGLEIISNNWQIEKQVLIIKNVNFITNKMYEHFAKRKYLHSIIIKNLNAKSFYKNI